MGRARFAVALPLCLACLASCGFSYRVVCDPSDAAITVGGEAIASGARLRLSSREVEVGATRPGFVRYEGRLRHAGLLGVQELRLSLRREEYAVTIGLTEGEAGYEIDESLSGQTPFAGVLQSGTHRLRLSPKAFPEQGFEFELEGPTNLVFRPQTDAVAIARLRPLGVYRCGSAPKQVDFSPDGSALYITLLDGQGFDILDWRSGRLSSVEVPVYGPSRGFVEGLFVPEHSSFLVTQMTRDMIHEYSLPSPESQRSSATASADPTWLRSFSTQGTWSKVAAYSPASDILAISNWVSGDVSILDYGSGRLLVKLGGIDTPRGLAFSPDGSRLAVASYGDGRLLRYDTSSWKLTDCLKRESGALRHIVGTRDGSKLYVSDMFRGEVLEIDSASFSVSHVYPARHNPNTIGLSGDGRILAVSCRGPNNSGGYTLRSPERGYVLVFDTRDRSLVAKIEGGTQPTGLAICGDSVLAFSNFQDATVELYDISRLLGP
jgi:DNA-binding beta-propeller fold protein YncE